MATVTRAKETITTTQQEDGTLEEHREPVYVYVHCVDPACPEYHDLRVDRDHEREVPGLRVETSYSYEELGGDMPGTERSNVEYRVQEPGDAKCPSCSKDLNVSEEKSRKLAPWTQRANPDTLAAYEAARKVAAQNSETATAEKDAELAELRASIAELQKQMPVKKSPGRPRKDGSPAQPRNGGNDGAASD